MAKVERIVAKAQRSDVGKIVKRRAGTDASSGTSASKAKAGAKILESRSGRSIITSPAKSANTINSWSNAFKRN